MPHEDFFGSNQKCCDDILRQLLDCLDRPLHPYITAAIGTAIVTMSWVEGDDEDDNEEILLESCQNLIGYTLSFAGRMRGREIEELKQASEEVAKAIFGLERTTHAMRLIREDVVCEMEPYGRLN